MLVSERVKVGTASGSLVRKMFDEGIILKQRYGEENVFDLSLGNPVVEPPPEFKSELKRLANNPIPGMHRYMENAGYRETRAAVAEQISKESGLHFTMNEIVMTAGAAAAANVVLKAILNNGDEVILLAPYFAEFYHYVTNHYGVVRVAPCDEQFQPDMDALEATINAKTKAVIVNSPNNPTGIVYGEEFIHNLGQLLQKKERQFGTQILMISDEAYRKILFDGVKYPFIWKHHPQSVVVTSHSKDLALQGERIGYIAVNPDIYEKKVFMDAIIYLNRTLGFVNAPALMQRIVARLQDVSVSAEDYQRKRDYLYDNLTAMGYSVVKPQGAFYIFPKSPIEDDWEFVRVLQNEYKVLTVPGSGFGTPGYFRIAYCLEDRVLEGSMDGLRKAANKYRLI